MLKEIRYSRWGGNNPAFPHDRAVYAIVGDCCYFSGIAGEYVPSTISIAENILVAIATHEKASVKDFRWFDLQTHLGYHHIETGSCVLNELTVLHNQRGAGSITTHKVKITGKVSTVEVEDTIGFRVTRWDEIPVPLTVRRLFREVIGHGHIRPDSWPGRCPRCKITWWWPKAGRTYSTDIRAVYCHKCYLPLVKTTGNPRHRNKRATRRGVCLPE